MIKVAISVNKCDSGGQKSLVMAYMRKFDRKRLYFDLIVDSDSNSIPFDEVKSLGGNVYVIPPYQNIISHVRALHKLFKREKYDVLPPKVEYYLTDIGLTLRPVIESMQKWGKDYKKLLKLMERMK